ncbi:Beta-glucosidase [compost metagenome]
MVTENGIATSNDKERVEFITEALNGLKRCQDDGINILGYMYWSLLDNFEWQKGFEYTFGLIEVNRNTFERIPKPSLYCLAKLI